MHVTSYKFQVAGCKACDLVTCYKLQVEEMPLLASRLKRFFMLHAITVGLWVYFMSSYRDLEIYKLSYDLALAIHRITLELPKYETYETGSQIRRSSKAITSNIVEGYGRKRYKADFIKFIVYAHASCDETITHLNFLRDLYNLKVSDKLEAFKTLGKKIHSFIEYVDSDWK